MSARWRLTALLALLGLGWGVTMPLTKIAVGTGYGPFGLIFWQLAIGAVVLGALQALRGGAMPLTARTLGFCLMIALIGTLLPNSATYRAAAHLPAGIMAIAVSTVPMFALPIALVLGSDRLSGLRILGLCLGLFGVALIALPEASLPDPAMAPWVLFVLLAPLCYAFEGNIVAKWGTAGLDPIQTLLGASVIGTAIALPLALSQGQFFVPAWPLEPADRAVLAIGAIHAAVYVSYVWMVGRAGAVFAAQVSYLVTGFGVLWSMALLGERYAPTVWAALAAMLAGLLLVQPRHNRALVSSDAAANDVRRRGQREPG